MPTVHEAPLDFPPPLRKKLTRDECARMAAASPEEYAKYELIEGELILKVGKSHRHIRALLLLTTWLRSVFTELMVLQEPTIDIHPQDNATSQPEPDALVLNRAYVELSGLAQPADIQLVVEVSGSSFGFDRTTKARLYARAGIVEYWIVDLERRRLIVHREPADGEYRSVFAYGENEPVAPLAAPEHAITAGQLL
jgi:Uma2 family endonuclease